MIDGIRESPGFASGFRTLRGRFWGWFC